MREAPTWGCPVMSASWHRNSCVCQCDEGVEGLVQNRKHQEPGDNEPGRLGGKGTSDKPAQAVCPRVPTLSTCGRGPGICRRSRAPARGRGEAEDWG